MKKGAASAPVFCLHPCWADACRWFWSEIHILFEPPFELQCWTAEILRDWGSYSCFGTFNVGHVPLYFPTYKMVWTNLSHNFIVFFSMSRVLLTLVCFWLAHSSAKLATLMELKAGGWAEAASAGVVPTGSAELPPLCKPAATQAELLLHTWNWKALWVSKVSFSPEGNWY